MEETSSEVMCDLLYESYWKPFVEVDGELDLKAVKAELFGYYYVLQHANVVYNHISAGTKNATDTAQDILLTMNKILMSDYAILREQDRAADQAEIASLKKEVAKLMDLVVYGDSPNTDEGK